MNFLKQPSIAGITMNPYFLYLDLTKPDKTYILPIPYSELANNSAIEQYDEWK